MHLSPDVPHLRGGGLLYLRDPHRLVAEGRRLGPRWSFRHPVYGHVLVVSSRELGEEVLAEDLPLAGAERYVDWLGLGTPLQPIPDEAQRLLLRYVDRAIVKSDPHYYVERALRPFTDAGGDVGPALRTAALAWLLDVICQSDQTRLHVAMTAARAWQGAARTVPLLVPYLRSWSPRYDDLVPAKLRLLAALADCEPGPLMDGRNGTYLAGGLLTLLGPVADALPMVAMAALSLRDPIFARRVDHAIESAHPVPLLLLKARRAGPRYLAVDLPGAGLPFGFGAVTPLLRAIVRKFATVTLGVASLLDLTATSAPRRARVRLCTGPGGPRMAQWPG